MIKNELEPLSIKVSGIVQENLTLERAVDFIKKQGYEITLKK